MGWALPVKIALPHTRVYNVGMSTEWVTTVEAASISGYHPEHIRELIRDKKIVAVKKGNAWWVDLASLIAYAKAAKQTEDKRHGPKRKRP